MQFAQTRLRANQAGAAGSKESIVLAGSLSQRLLLAEHICVSSRIAILVTNTRCECMIMKILSGAAILSSPVDTFKHLMMILLQVRLPKEQHSGVFSLFPGEEAVCCSSHSAQD